MIIFCDIIEYNRVLFLQKNILIIFKREFIMRKQRKLIAVGLIATSMILLITACSANNNQKNVTDEGNKIEKSIDSTKKYIKSQSEIIERHRKQYYFDGAEHYYTRAVSEANENKDSIHLSYDNLDKKLRGLKVEIGSYDSSTKRLAITVTNKYSETLIGTKNQLNDDRYKNFIITIRGYDKKRLEKKQAGTDSYLYASNETGQLLSFQPTEDLKSGESKTYHILMPYYAFSQHNSKVDAENEQYKNKQFDDEYSYNEQFTMLNLVYETLPDEPLTYNSLDNYDNLFIFPQLVFKTYPKEAFVSDKQIIEVYKLKF